MTENPSPRRHCRLLLISGDIVNYTDIVPVIQFSEVVVERSEP
ncbi:MAG: hypothetical protein K0R58_2284 [Ramlibacter sp.]|jgi:hypothetical protein|nr:hypothetical protein [Ramlibacter sp.]